jgi:DNA-directed RNA polymerase subunit RPC12/RpoP
MYFKKINNATLWRKIQKLRELIALESNFSKRSCWKCGKELNIYDFLSDNVGFSSEYLLKLWQSPILEYHCCECYKSLNTSELDKIQQILDYRSCEYCSKQISFFKFSEDNSYLKIHELKEVWLNEKKPLFCDNLCKRKFFKNYNI